MVRPVKTNLSSRDMGKDHRVHRIQDQTGQQLPERPPMLESWACKSRWADVGYNAVVGIQDEAVHALLEDWRQQSKEGKYCCLRCSSKLLLSLPPLAAAVEAASPPRPDMAFAAKVVADAECRFVNTGLEVVTSSVLT